MKKPDEVANINDIRIDIKKDKRPELNLTPIANQ